MPRITAALPNFLRKLSTARSAWAARRSSMSVSSATEPSRRALTPAPIRRKAVPSISFASISRQIEKIFAASCVGAVIDCERVRWRKSAVFSFSGTGKPASSLLLRRDDVFSHSRHRIFSSVAKSRMSVSNVVSLEIVLAPRSGSTRRSSMPRESPQPAAVTRKLPHHLDLVGLLQVRDDAEAALHQTLLRRGSNAENETDRLLRQHQARFLLVERGKPARLVEVGGDLRQELVAGEADRDADADVALDVACEPRQHLCRDHAVHPLGAGEIEEGLVDRERLDQRRQRLHGLAYLAPNPDIFRHVRRDHGGMRAGFQRLVHRHGRPHAVGAGDVAGGRHHAALAPADDHGLVGDVGIVALLDGRVEGVAVDMCDGQACERAVAGEAGGTAGGTAPHAHIQIGRTNPAEAAGAGRLPGGHGTSRSQLGSPSASPRTCLAAATLVGCSSAVLAKAFTVASSRITKSSTLSRKLGSEAALRSISGPTPVSARNRPSRSGSPATKDSA